MNTLYEERIIPPMNACFTPTNTTRRQKYSACSSSITNESRGYGTLRSRDLEVPVKPYEYFDPHITSTRNNTILNNPVSPPSYRPRASQCIDEILTIDTSRTIRKCSDSSAELLLPIAPPCSIDGNLDSDDDCVDVFLTDDEPLPAIPPCLRLQYFNCELCDDVYYRRESLDNHLQLHMLDKQPVCTGKLKKFKCSHCGKKYNEKKKLNMHTMQRHKPSVKTIMVL